MNLGERLYEMRKAKGFSQEEVAERLSVTRQTVSKWETGQSTPDFDKVLPLCALYGITTDELFTGEPAEKPTAPEEQPAPEADHEVEIQLQKQKFRERSAWVVSVAVFLYIASVVVLMIGITVLMVNPVIMSGIFMLIAAFATAMLIRHYMSKPKFAETPREKEKNTLKGRIKKITAIVVLILYLLLSFLTMAWQITWILWCMYGLICEIIDLIFMLKEGEKHEA